MTDKVKGRVSKEAHPQQNENEGDTEGTDHKLSQGAAAGNAGKEQPHKRSPGHPPGPEEQRPGSQPGLGLLGGFGESICIHGHAGE